ncbi:MarR family winged helix-turn-helix transcriptional regulator [Herpetosiphon sp. NSE202]|uniref:MarR family winged helix-turn-helix transcriptional regulator n=1 Tax=Herpetosiphon sp. NSE202 TaxID=3351349 RepID=UPI00363F443D
MQDQVDCFIAEWQRERPDLDASPMGLIGRIARLEQHLSRELARVFSQFGLQRGEFDVLASLRRSGAPYQRSPTALFNTLMLSSGAMTNRLDRLAARGLIERIPDPHDRRSLLVQLTAQGLDLINQAVEAHLANERRLIASLSTDQHSQLAELLRTWLLDLEQPQA